MPLPRSFKSSCKAEISAILPRSNTKAIKKSIRALLSYSSSTACHLESHLLNICSPGSEPTVHAFPHAHTLSSGRNTTLAWWCCSPLHSGRERWKKTQNILLSKNFPFLIVAEIYRFWQHMMKNPSQLQKLVFFFFNEFALMRNWLLQPHWWPK